MTYLFVASQRRYLSTGDLNIEGVSFMMAKGSPGCTVNARRCLRSLSEDKTMQVPSDHDADVISLFVLALL